MAAQIPPLPEPPLEWSRTTSAQRRTLVAAALGWMLDAFDVLLYSIVLATLMREFGMTKFTAGLLNTLTLIASAMGSLAFGWLADRFGRRRMLSLSILTYSLFTFVCGFSTTVTTLAVFRFFLGFGMGGEYNCGVTLVAETWPYAWRGRALALVQSSWAIGYALAAIVASLVLSRLNWRWVFFVGVFPALLTFWVQQHVPEPEVWLHQVVRPVLSRAEKAALWRLVTPRLLVLLAMNTFGMFGWWGLFTWIPAYLSLPAAKGGRDFSAFGLTSFLVILNLCGMFPGYLVFGVFADKLGRKRTLVAYLAAAALSVAGFAMAHRPVSILMAASIAAFFGTGFFTGSAVLGTELFPTPIRATALGISYNTARGFSAFAPLIIGTLGESHGLSSSFFACAVAFALAALSALFIRETSELDVPHLHSSPAANVINLSR